MGGARGVPFWPRACAEPVRDVAAMLLPLVGRLDVEHERDVHGGEFAHRVAIAEAAGGVTGVSPWI